MSWKKDAKTRYMTIRVTDELAESAYALAERKGINTINGLVRMLLIEAVKKEFGQPD